MEYRREYRREQNGCECHSSEWDRHSNNTYERCLAGTYTYRSNNEKMKSQHVPIVWLRSFRSDLAGLAGNFQSGWADQYASAVRCNVEMKSLKKENGAGIKITYLSDRQPGSCHLILVANVRCPLPLVLSSLSFSYLSEFSCATSWRIVRWHCSSKIKQTAVVDDSNPALNSLERRR